MRKNNKYLELESQLALSRDAKSHYKMDGFVSLGAEPWTKSKISALRPSVSRLGKLRICFTILNQRIIFSAGF